MIHEFLCLVLEFFQLSVSKGETNEKYEDEKDRVRVVNGCSNDGL
jgi:hypothetical protein